MCGLFTFTDCNESCDSKADWLSGLITSLDCDQDGFYDYNLKCTWTITGEVYLEVKIHVNDLDIQESENCIFDYVQVNKDLLYTSLTCHTPTIIYTLLNDPHAKVTKSS